MNDDTLKQLATIAPPKAGEAARACALASAMAAFDAEEKNSAAPKGSAEPARLTDRARKLWSKIMNRKLTASPAIAGLLVLPIAGYATYYLAQETPFRFDDSAHTLTAKPAEPKQPAAEQPRGAEKAEAPVTYESEIDQLAAAPAPNSVASSPAAEAARGFDIGAPVGIATNPANRAGRVPGLAGNSKLLAPTNPPATANDAIAMSEEERERFLAFDNNPVRSAAESPVSTFSIDVDTASYSFVRRSLKEGYLPQGDTVRVEEMINYFPYDWTGPTDASVPFNSTVTVMPTPWNDQTKLMHIAIQGYDVQPETRPKANLVFLLDVSGSMNAPDKLPLLQSAFRMLVNQLNPDDTVSIVTYAGESGVVLEPTKGSEKNKILRAIDQLKPSGTTAGEAGLRDAYRLAQQSFVEGGVNRIMLATDGDFNVGQTDDADLKRMIEEKRESGVFLSVFGFGRGNLNDQLMQTIAQNGNGTAAYIDTLAEAEKVLVEEARSTLFNIAKDVKIQVEFNPETVAEYRLIGYETRALNREDFNNDRVDAGEIGSGHSVTAIYEITPKGSSATMIDDLRYGEASTDNATGVAHGDEYAFVKIRYKLPDEDVSKLITTPVTKANEVASFDAATADQRFSVAVAAFGQKLRNTDQTAGMDYQKIMEIAAAARGTDPFGYRSEFLSLVRLASALESGRR